MSSYGTVAALAALFLAGCASSSPPPVEVSQGAASATDETVIEESGTPEFNNARIGRDDLRSRIQN